MQKYNKVATCLIHINDDDQLKMQLTWSFLSCVYPIHFDNTIPLFEAIPYESNPWFELAQVQIQLASFF